MEVGIPGRRHDAVGEGLSRNLTICCEHRVQAVVDTIVFLPCRDERRVALAVRVDQQNTGVGCSGATKDSSDTKRDGGGRRRFPDAAFMVGEYKNTSHCIFLTE